MVALTCCPVPGRSASNRSARTNASSRFFPKHLCPCAVRELHSCVPRNESQTRASRRVLLSSTLALVPTLTFASEAFAFDTTPSGYYRHTDILDGYTFVYPEGWLPVTTSGNDTFFRNPRVADENVFVDISSPSSSRYTTVEILGSPDDARRKLEQQFLKEYMSTRLGVRREIQPLYAQVRTGAGLPSIIKHHAA
jgi:hypothetical protein